MRIDEVLYCSHSAIWIALHTSVLRWRWGSGADLILAAGRRQKSALLSIYFVAGAFLGKGGELVPSLCGYDVMPRLVSEVPLFYYGAKPKDKGNYALILCNYVYNSILLKNPNALP